MCHTPVTHGPRPRTEPQQLRCPERPERGPAMFRSFFLNRQWWHWSILGSALILFATWYRVQLDVKLNEWFGTFYDLLQKALSAPGSVTISAYWGQVATFLNIAMIYITVAVLAEFFVKHYV